MQLIIIPHQRSQSQRRLTLGYMGGTFIHDIEFIVDFSLEKRLWDFEKFGHLNLKAQINNIFAGL
ncbi:MAG: hypothetical protein LBV23_07000 [Deltaproteobacteria bacterium]|jgi:hypothetical protein|nr:hypothetical protein [Deltaproteobacteria bacterium]